MSRPAASAAGLREQPLAFQAAVPGRPLGAGLLRPGSGGQPAALAVYRHGHGARLALALLDNFEVLVQAMGDDAFEALAAAYSQARPSTTPSIRWLGHQLADFMAQQAHADSDLVAHPALADIVRMDWALRAAFDAADAPLLQRDALTSLPAEQWPDLRPGLHPSVQQLTLDWAVEPAWQLLRLADANDEPALTEPEPHRHELLVWRQGLESRWRALAERDVALLRALASGQHFAALCALAAEQAPGVQTLPRVAALLQQWLAAGLLCLGNSG